MIGSSVSLLNSASSNNITHGASLTINGSSGSLSLLPSVSVGSLSNSGEIFHFICFVPIDGRLYELDGLKPFPIDHGSILNDSNWTNKFTPIIKDRISSFNSGTQNHEIRFNLMALVPDKVARLSRKLEVLRHNTARLFYEPSSIKHEIMREKCEVEVIGHEMKSSISCREITVLKQDSIENQESETSKVLNNVSADHLLENIKFENEALINHKNESKLIFSTDSNTFDCCDYSRVNESGRVDIMELLKRYKLIKIQQFIKDEGEIELINTIDSTNGIDRQFIRIINQDSVRELFTNVSNEIDADQSKLNEELDKRKKYKVPFYF